MGKKSREKAARRRGDAPPAAPKVATRPDGDLGTQVADDLHRLLMIDEEWTLREERGFTWWAHRHPQRIWAEPVLTDLGERTTRIHIETPLVRKAGDARRLLQFSALANTMTTLGAVTADPAEQRVVMHTAATVHGENRPWLGKLLSVAALLQLLKAEQTSSQFAEAVGGEPDQTEMPGRGVRPQPDDMLASASMLQQAGARDPFANGDFAAARKMLRDMPARDITASDEGVTIELRDPPDYPARLVVVRNQHPDLGYGLLQLLHLPRLEDPSRGPEFANQLNRQESARAPRGHLLGGWCFEPKAEGLTFVSFLPALAVGTPSASSRRDLLVNLIVAHVIRAQFAPEVLAPARFAQAAEDEAKS